MKRNTQEVCVKRPRNAPEVRKLTAMVKGPLSESSLAKSRAVASACNDNNNNNNNNIIHNLFEASIDQIRDPTFH